MSYIAEIIKRECADCQAELIESILQKAKVSNPKMERQFSIWNHFNAKRQEGIDAKMFRWKATSIATKSTTSQFKISRYALHRVRKLFEK